MYIKKLINSLKPVFILIIINQVVLFLVSFLYGMYDLQNIDKFINKYASIIVLITNLTYIIYLFKKNHITLDKFNVVGEYPKIYLFICLPILLNSIIFLINKSSITITLNRFIAFSGTVIIGPIIEELVFRYSLYNSLTNFNNKSKSIILSSLIFAIIHITPIKIAYAFIIGIIITIIYSKDQNLTKAITLHIVSNLMGFIIEYYQPSVMLLSTLGTIFSIYLLTLQEYSPTFNKTTKK